MQHCLNTCLLFNTNLPAIIGAAVFVFVICVPITIWVLLRSFQRRWIEKKKLFLLRVEHDNELLKTKVEAQEQTFRHISAEIHDNIGQQLSMARFLAERLTEHGADAAGLSEILGRSISDLRNLSHSLSANAVIELGLADTIKEELALLKRGKKIQAEFIQIGVPPQLSEHTAISLYRVFREAIQNIITHSKANKVKVFMSVEDEYLHLGIADNGIGISPGTPEGNGLKNMQDRLRTLDGSLTIDTDKKGTSLLIKTPVHEKE